MQPVAAPMCVETEMLHAFVAGSMERGRFYLPDGPRIAAAALLLSKPAVPRAISGILTPLFSKFKSQSGWHHCEIFDLI